MYFWIGAYQLHPFRVVDRAQSTNYLPNPFRFVEASVKGDSKRVSHIFHCHFCKLELPIENCVSDLPFKVGEESAPLMSSAFSLFFKGKKFSASRKKIG